MNRFVIVDSLPYLYAGGKTYAVRWDSKGFTVGAEVKLASVPPVTYSELSVKAKCAILDSIGAEPENVPEETATESNPEVGAEPENVPEETASEQVEPEKPLNEMMLAELKDFAKAHGIELNGARTKATIIEAIKAAR